MYDHIPSNFLIEIVVCGEMKTACLSRLAVSEFTIREISRDTGYMEIIVRNYDNEM
jgi:hypothetical protein